MEFVAELCSYFCWTDDYALAMPFHRFCSMLKNGRRWHARRMIELIDVQSVSLGDDDHYKKIRESYSNLFDYERAKEEEFVMDTSDPAQFAVIRDAFRRAKGDG